MNKRKILSIICMSVLVFTTVFSAIGTTRVYAEGEDQKDDEKTESVTDEGDSDPQEEVKRVVIKVSTQEELMEIADYCHDDIWSYDKTILLTDDISIVGSFESIPYFNGVFDGAGHTIRNYRYRGDRYINGFINEIGSEGLVENLILEAGVQANEDAQCIGALAGINAGAIDNCKVYGTIKAGTEVGGIVGINQRDGLIRNTENHAQITGFYYTGGIAGKNYGTISGCRNFGNINNGVGWIQQEDENSENSLLKSTENTDDLISVHSGVDTGGIAGYSVGIIHRSQNDAVIGYEHAGYNVGGIAGRQAGIIVSSWNKGTVYGKKDIGGIIGQQEPYIEIDQGKSLRYSANALAEDIDKLVSDTEKAGKALDADLKALKQQSDALKDKANNFAGDISESKEERNETIQNNKELVERDKETLKNGIPITDIPKIPGARIDQKKYERQTVKNGVNTFQQNNEQWTTDLNEITAELDQMSAVLDRVGKNAKRNKDMLSDDLQAVNERVDSTYQLLNDITSGLEEEGVSYLFSDLSEEAIDLDLTGKTLNCTNQGVVKGDIGTGGIVGAMAVDDENLESNQIITFGLKTGEAYSTVSVVRGCTNEGFISSRKDKTGGIAGYMEQGILYDCHGFGEISAEERNYVGGLCGLSKGSINKGYVLCSISGDSYVGGVAGSGVKIKNCVSMPILNSTGDNTGAVAGEIPRDRLTKESNFSEIRGNVFVSEDHYGIDDVNYHDIAEKITYQELCELNDLPREYKHLTVTYRVEDEVILKSEYPYGEDLSVISCPEVAGKDGNFVNWPDLSGVKMLGNMVVEAEYLQNITVIPSELKDNDNTVAFVGGQFNAEDKIEVTPIISSSVEAGIPEVADAKDFRGYHIGVLESNQTKEGRIAGDFSYTLRLYKPFKYCEVWEIREEGGQIRKLDVEERGSYIATALPDNGATYVMIEVNNPLYKTLIIAGAIAAVLILVIVSVVIIRVKKKKKNKDK